MYLAAYANAKYIELLLIFGRSCCRICKADGTIVLV